MHKLQPTNCISYESCAHRGNERGEGKITNSLSITRHFRQRKKKKKLGKNQ